VRRRLTPAHRSMNTTIHTNLKEESYGYERCSTGNRRDVRGEDCARIHDVNLKLDAFEAKAKAARTEAEATAIKGLKAARAEVDASLGALQKSIDDVRTKYTSAPEQK
jgi:hypothetical protein